METVQPLRPTLWRTCRVLANRTRLDILALLLREPGLTVSDVARELNLSLPVASQYLRGLEARGLLTARRRARQVHYQFATPNAEGPASPMVAPLRQVFKRSIPPEHVFALATAFTHPRRIKIFRALQQQPRDFQELKEAARLSTRALRRHLDKLMRRGFVVSERKRYRCADTRSAFGRALARMAAT